MKKMIWTAGAVVILDQLVKAFVKSTMKLFETIPVIKGLFNISFIENRGIAFGIFGQGNEFVKRWLLLLVVAAAMLVIIVYWFLNYTDALIYNISCGLILGGAFGNFIDRLLMGYVVDFIEVGYGKWSFPVFNLADSAVTCGVILFAWFTLFHKEVPLNASHTS